MPMWGMPVIRRLQQQLLLKRGFRRREMLTSYLLLVGGNTSIGYFLSPNDAVRMANLIATVIAIFLLMLVRRKSLFEAIVHGVTALTVVLVTYTAIHTGGINSPAVVWLNVLAVPVLLMLGPAATLRWIVINLVMVLGLMLGTHLGWIVNHVASFSQQVLWSYLNHALALCNLMVGVHLYEYLHQFQLRKLDEGNQALKTTHQALMQAQAHKDEFVAAVGHELRTPMNAILGFNGVLRREFADQPEQLEVVGHIRRSTEHLLQVVNDILDFSQLQAGRLHPSPVDFELPQLIDELRTRYHDKAISKGVTLAFSMDPVCPIRLHADRLRLHQILSNLLDNAIKFTHQGVVSLRVTTVQAGLRFEVQDTGRGIPLAHQQTIFRRFEHADVQTNRTYGGTGLGLTLCENLVTLLGGQIGVISQEGHGALFWFEVPWEPAHSALAPQLVRDLKDEALRILVVDDNPVNLMVAQLQLQKCWPLAEVMTCPSAAAALERLDAQVFDVALVDMVMPDMDGMQLTQQIRQQFPAIAARMPIIALTANTNPVDRDRCLAAGMDDVLHKPMDTQAMVRAVSTQVQRSRGDLHA